MAGMAARGAILFAIDWNKGENFINKNFIRSANSLNNALMGI